MTGWPEMLATALVGTDRRSTSAAATGTDPARDLLEQAAACSVYRRAGVRPVRGLTAPESAPVETTPTVSEAAAATLADLLVNTEFAVTEYRGGFVAEWLTLAVARNRRIPPELLPALLDAGRRRTELRPLIVAAGGLRTGWLAAQNPEWTYLTAEVAESMADPVFWHEGTKDQRAGYLTDARRADPVAARDLLAADWPTLPPDERAQLLAILATGLGPDDEEFLEHALGDRRKEVRDAAVVLLAKLPGSAFNARMADRAHACLRVRGGRISVEPPTECDNGMRRDGILPKTHSGKGERAFWLEQILAGTPLSTLTSIAPADYLTLSIEEGWDTPVLHGLAQAAAAQRDPAWAAALLDVLEPQKLSSRRWIVEDLYPALDPDELVRRSIVGLRDPEAGLGRFLERLLEQCPAPWPDGLVAAALDGIPVHARHKRMPYDIYAVCRLAGMRMPADRASEAARIVEQFRRRRSTKHFRTEHPDHGRVDAFEHLARTLDFRHQMIQEI